MTKMYRDSLTSTLDFPRSARPHSQEGRTKKVDRRWFSASREGGNWRNVFWKRESFEDEATFDSRNCRKALPAKGNRCEGDRETSLASRADQTNKT